jgi:hypothetical protein
METPIARKGRAAFGSGSSTIGALLAGVPVAAVVLADDIAVSVAARERQPSHPDAKASVMVA